MQVPDTKRGKRMKVKGCMSIERAKETEVKGHMSAWAVVKVNMTLIRKTRVGANPSVWPNQSIRSTSDWCLFWTSLQIAGFSVNIVIECVYDIEKWNKYRHIMMCNIWFSWQWSIWLISLINQSNCGSWQHWVKCETCVHGRGRKRECHWGCWYERGSRQERACGNTRWYLQAHRAKREV